MNKTSVVYQVRKIVLEVASPLVVNGKHITDPWDVDPSWRLGFPAPIGMSKDRIIYTLVPRIAAYVKSVKPGARFSQGDIKDGMTVGDLQDAVWNKVK
jgi:hypothetical protein